MKRIVPIALLYAFSALAQETVLTRVHSFDKGNGKEPDLLFLESGHVVKLSSQKGYSFTSRADWFKFSIDKDHKLLRAVKSPAPYEARNNSKNVPQNYEPSVVDGGRTAKRYFNESRISRGSTQCYNRAEVWTYELWKKHGVKSQKIFLFFSRKYIREHHFGWWFHVAPLVTTKEWSGKSEKVFDPRFITAPRDIDWWVSKFVVSGTECKEIQSYSEYADYPYSEDCYFLKAPMYIYQPLDLEMQEVWGVQKNDFSKNDLTWAYKEAFQTDYAGE